MSDYQLIELNLLDNRDQPTFGWFRESHSGALIMRRTTGEPLGRNFALPSEQTIQKDEYRFSALWSNGEDFHWSTHEISGSRFVSLDEAETLAYYLLSDFAIKVERLSRKLIRFVRGGKV